EADPGDAQRAVHGVAQRADADPDDPRLLAALAQHELPADLAALTARSLNERPALDDERFGRLINLYTASLQQPAEAAAWCHRFAQEFTDSDLPWRTWVNVLEQFPDAGDVIDVLSRWAAAREGPEQATIYLELAE